MIASERKHDASVIGAFEIATGMTRWAFVSRFIISIGTVSLTIADQRVVNTFVRVAATSTPTACAWSIAANERGLVTSISAVKVFIAIICRVDAVTRVAPKFGDRTSLVGAA